MVVSCCIHISASLLNYPANEPLQETTVVAAWSWVAVEACGLRNQGRMDLPKPGYGSSEELV